MYQRSAVFSHGSLALIATCLVSYGLNVHLKTERSTMCLAEDLYHEGRGEGTENMKRIGKIMLARVIDTDRQWPKTICGAIGQDYQNSWVLDYRLATKRDEQQKWAAAQEIARELLQEARTDFSMPEGWECARFYKRTDNKGVSRASLRFFEKKLVAVGTFGSHTAYREKGGCKLSMPTA